jgi:short-subunit dehydrogenase
MRSPSAAGRDLQGARIAVVGATGALGTLLVAELSARGARLLAVGRDADRLEALAAEARVRRVLPLLEESRGFVAQLSAVVVEQPLPRMAAYSASKAALSAAAVALRTELRRSHVDVLDVRPPHTETGLAGRPLSGQAPRLPAGKDPAAVARRVVDAIAAGEQDLGPEAFG